jgi:hypothetical protein
MCIRFRFLWPLLFFVMLVVAGCSAPQEPAEPLPPGMAYLMQAPAGRSGVCHHRLLLQGRRKFLENNEVLPGGLYPQAGPSPRLVFLPARIERLALRV